MRIDGVSELVRKLKEMPTDLARGELKRAVRMAAQPIRDRMATIAPRGDPHAPNVSDIVITPIRSQDDPLIQGVWIGPNRDAYYAYFLEYGTKHMSARPFARPALDSEEETAQAVLKDRVWRAFLGALA